MAMRILTARLGRGSDGLAGRALLLADCILRGFAQVLLVNRAPAGALFLTGIACSSPRHAAGAVLGAAAATFGAVLLRADPGEVRQGLHGFNGVLAALALLGLMPQGPLLWPGLALAAGLTAPVFMALGRWLARRTMPALTAPFILLVWASVLLVGKAPPAAPAMEAAGGWLPPLLEGLFNGLAQTFFQQGALSGLLVAAGLLVASRAAFVAALAGSLIGLGVATAAGMTDAAIRAGLHGYNGVLVGIALGAVFLPRSRASVVLTLAALVVTPLVHAAFAASVRPVGLPPLTFAFVTVTWTFLLLSRRLQAPPQPAGADDRHPT